MLWDGQEGVPALESAGDWEAARLPLTHTCMFPATQKEGNKERRQQNCGALRSEFIETEDIPKRENRSENGEEMEVCGGGGGGGGGL